ncbi:hypothetical protein HYH02_002493 [Chlamydomonas schloesseri]|uniref:Guanylate cyclase domain-containing protein n=1 Tax=Chlamydomonas schloesseri TaxID=2026947 RepID=A0A835WTK3_9CHLO|nr:hypothetical protein HYH02_002493 [Chlamydomonas schloesseri]|eukprot:KAG2453169.1 hypothetical protein HYH02_002493 [Chlamydomonas schloesseri]
MKARKVPRTARLSWAWLFIYLLSLPGARPDSALNRDDGQEQLKCLSAQGTKALSFDVCRAEEALEARSAWAGLTTLTRDCIEGLQQATQATPHATDANGTFGATRIALAFSTFLRDLANNADLNVSVQLINSAQYQAWPDRMPMWPSAADAGPYDYWFVEAEVFGEASRRGAFVELTQVLALDDEYQFSDIPVSWRASASSASYGGAYSALPMVQWAWPLLYRRDLFQQLNISVPNSWDDVIYLAERYGRGQLGPGMPEHAFCFESNLACNSPHHILNYIVGSITQTRGPSQGWAFDPSDMKFMYAEPQVLREALRIFTTLQPHSISGSGPVAQACAAVYRGLGSGQCLMLWGYSFAWKASSHKSGALPGRQGLSRMPASTRVLDRASGQLVECNEQLCPYGRRTTDLRSGRPTMVNNVLPLKSVSLAINAFSQLHRQAAAFTAIRTFTLPRRHLALTLDPNNEATPIRNSELQLEDWVAAGYDPTDAREFIAYYLRSLEHKNVMNELNIPGVYSYYDMVREVLRLAMAGRNSTEQLAAFAAATAADILRRTPGGRDAALAAYRRSISYVAPRDGASTASEGSSSSSETVLLVSILVPVAAALVAAGAAVWVGLRWRRRRRERRQAREAAPGAGPDTTLLVTDIESSTVLWESLEAATMDAAIKLHHRIIRQLLLQHGGYESVTEGDSFITVHRKPDRALAFALATQEALLVADWPAELLASPHCQTVRVAPDPGAVLGLVDMAVAAPLLRDLLLAPAAPAAAAATGMGPAGVGPGIASGRVSAGGMALAAGGPGGATMMAMSDGLLPAGAGGGVAKPMSGRPPARSPLYFRSAAQQQAQRRRVPSGSSLTLPWALQQQQQQQQGRTSPSHQALRLLGPSSSATAPQLAPGLAPLSEGMTLSAAAAAAASEAAAAASLAEDEEWQQGFTQSVPLPRLQLPAPQAAALAPLPDSLRLQPALQQPAPQLQASSRSVATLQPAASGATADTSTVTRTSTRALSQPASMPQGADDLLTRLCDAEVAAAAAAATATAVATGPAGTGVRAGSGPAPNALVCRSRTAADSTPGAGAPHATFGLAAGGGDRSVSGPMSGIPASRARRASECSSRSGYVGAGGESYRDLADPEALEQRSQQQQQQKPATAPSAVRSGRRRLWSAIGYSSQARLGGGGPEPNRPPSSSLAQRFMRPFFPLLASSAAAAAPAVPRPGSEAPGQVAMAALPLGGDGGEPSECDIGHDIGIQEGDVAGEILDSLHHTASVTGLMQSSGAGGAWRGSRRAGALSSTGAGDELFALCLTLRAALKLAYPVLLPAPPGSASAASTSVRAPGLPDYPHAGAEPGHRSARVSGAGTSASVATPANRPSNCGSQPSNSVVSSTPPAAAVAEASATAIVTTAAAASASATTDTPAQPGTLLLFRGLRVRMGLHRGVAASEVRFNAASSRTCYTGHALAVAKCVTDAGRGGHVLLSHSALRGLDPKSSVLQSAVVLAEGTRVVKAGEGAVELVAAFSRPLVARAACLEDLRVATTAVPPVLAAPLGRVAVALAQVQDPEEFMSWGLEASLSSHRAVLRAAAALAVEYGGYMVGNTPGSYQAVFTSAEDAMGWMLTLQEDLGPVMEEHAHVQGPAITQARSQSQSQHDATASTSTPPTSGSRAGGAQGEAEARDWNRQLHRAVAAARLSIYRIKGGVDVGLLQAVLQPGSSANNAGGLNYSGVACKRCACLVANAAWNEVLASMEAVADVLGQQDQPALQGMCAAAAATPTTKVPSKAGGNLRSTLAERWAALHPHPHQSHHPSHPPPAKEQSSQSQLQLPHASTAASAGLAAGAAAPQQPEILNTGSTLSEPCVIPGLAAPGAAGGDAADSVAARSLTAGSGAGVSRLGTFSTAEEPGAARTFIVHGPWLFGPGVKGIKFRGNAVNACLVKLLVQGPQQQQQQQQ